MQGRLRNLSLRGLSLAADESLLEHIQSFDERGVALFPEEFSALFSLPLEGRLLEVEVHCRLVHKRRLSQHAYHLGITILHYRGESEAHLERYIDAHL